ncbi:hypothetical protein HYI18_18030 [Clostridium botulinum]|uniref:HMA2 domain-containing protein n=1 Tax=Clostridium botulinum TaxID=1491 RepID=UPI00174A1875|nr:hypothetical protein [Clostridium botulinum]MBD5640460.1 hypothetical protein [Clostridium botulinum]
MIDAKIYGLVYTKRIKVLHSIEGRVRIKLPDLDKIPEKYKIHEEDGIKAVKMLKGIKDVSINYVIGTCIINYDSNLITVDKILRWIKKIIKVNIDNIKLYEQYGEENPKQVINIVEEQLRLEIKNI